jgi:acetyl-CoA synthetase
MHSSVVESAVVGYPHDIKGQGVYALLYALINMAMMNYPQGHHHDGMHVSLVPIAKPDKIQFVSGLPKTRSGKIMRRILRKIAEGDTSNLGDTSTLLDPSVVDEIKAGAL